MTTGRLHPRGRRLGRAHWTVLIFLAGFTVGLVVLSYVYLMPALRASLEAKQQGDRAGWKAISATSALLMAVILIILVTGLMLTFRVGRMFFPKGAGPRTRTKYVDAWAESGKRMEVREEGEEE